VLVLLPRGFVEELFVNERKQGAAAIGSEQTRKYVLVVGADNKVQQKYVTPGQLTSDGLRVIKAGLSPDDRVVVDGLMRARAEGTGNSLLLVGADEEDEKDEGELPTELAVRAALACSGAEAGARSAAPDRGPLLRP